MEENGTVVVVMLKDGETGFLEKELCSFRVAELENLLTNIYAARGPEGLEIHLRASTGADVEDWQFNAVYDYYDEGALSGLGLNVAVNEAEDAFNPEWEIVFPLPEGSEGVEDAGPLSEAVAQILRAHGDELASVFLAIGEADVERRYREEAGGP